MAIDNLINIFTQASEIFTALGIVLGALGVFSGRLKKWLGIHDLRVGLKRLEIMNLIQHTPENSGLICELYDEYKDIDGNSYIDALFGEWKNKFRDGIKK